MKLKEIEIDYETLFEIIKCEENFEFELDKEYNQKTTIQIQDENNKWTNINALIKKEDIVVTLEIDSKETLICAENHLILMADKTLKKAKDLVVGDIVYVTNDYLNGNITSIKFNKEKRVVYDMEIDNETHLYQTANGMVHHNTLLTAAIIKYANKLNMKTITIVPSSSLLKQTFEYIKQFDIPVGMFGAGKKDDEINMVCTWQTLQHNKFFMRSFECVIWDEVHGAKAYVAQQIMNEAVNSFIRVGLTGTIPKDPLDKANLTAAFGPVIYNVKAKDLQKRNILSSIHINIFELVYPKEYRYAFSDWHEESLFLQQNEMFQKLMKAIIETLEGNTLILMKNVEPAEKLANFLKCEYISAKLNIHKRQEKFNNFKFGGNLISVGTYSLLSTGIDIVHINNLILAPTLGKSFVKTIQSIGRGLRRKAGEKEHVNVIDLSSNLKFDKRHLTPRKNFYKEAQYPYEFSKINMDEL